MKINILIIFQLMIIFLSCEGQNDDSKFIFFLHNRFLEEHELNELHPKYGRTEYKEIISKFQNSGFKIISEKRNGNVNAREYAIGIVKQIDSLIKSGMNKLF